MRADQVGPAAPGRGTGQKITARPQSASTRCRSVPDTRFAWCGPTMHEPDMNGESYFRVHGPNLLIEHAPQGNQGGYKWHVHTIMRDLGDDYGRALTSQKS